MRRGRSRPRRRPVGWAAFRRDTRHELARQVGHPDGIRLFTLDLIRGLDVEGPLEIRPERDREGVVVDVGDVIPPSRAPLFGDRGCSTVEEEEALAVAVDERDDFARDLTVLRLDEVFLEPGRALARRGDLVRPARLHQSFVSGPGRLKPRSTLVVEGCLLFWHGQLVAGGWMGAVTCHSLPGNGWEQVTVGSLVFSTVSAAALTEG